jgi:phosphoserine aminotransferase
MESVIPMLSPTSTATCGPPSAARAGRRCHNFSGGPGALPRAVLEQTAGAIDLFEDTGDSILGLSHRSSRCRQIVDDAEATIRRLADVPPDYRVLFLQGGGSLQFAMIPMHLLLGAPGPAEYITSGYWSAKAVPEARSQGEVRVLWSGEADGYRRLPRADELAPGADAAYLHYVSNETVEGLQFPYLPGRDDVPRICDMSSDFLSRPVDVSRFDLIYAHAQKNLGPAGVTVVLIRDWILDRGRPLPAVLRYRTHADAGSIFNTPPVFAIYVTGLVARWLEHDIGGLAAMQARNEAKARCLYDTLDAAPDVFEVHAEPWARSTMNVAFRLRRRELEPVLVAAAARAGFLGIAGHRSVGGLRVSLYNAVEPEAVAELAGFLAEFAQATASTRS